MATVDDIDRDRVAGQGADRSAPQVVQVLNFGGGREWLEWQTSIARYEGAKILLASNACAQKGQLVILTGEAAADVSLARSIAASGRHIVLDGARMMPSDGLAALAADAERSAVLVFIAAAAGPNSPAKALRGHVRRVGSVSHVSYIRRESAPAQGAVADAPYSQWLRSGLNDVAGLRQLFDADARQVMARCSRGAVSEVFVELDDKVEIQYFGSLVSHKAEESLWVEGSGGSLWCAGAWVRWRKRGWPKFIPWRWRLTRPTRLDLAAAARKEILTHVVRVLSGGPQAEASRRATRQHLALLGSVMLSSERGAVVEVANWWQ